MSHKRPGRKAKLRRQARAEAGVKLLHDIFAAPEGDGGKGEGNDAD